MDDILRQVFGVGEFGGHVRFLYMGGKETAVLIMQVRDKMV